VKRMQITLATAASPVLGGLLDVDALRSAFPSVSILFLLNGMMHDEYTQPLVTLAAIREAGIERIVKAMHPMPRLCLKRDA
jgi:hypothetical protein